MTQVTHVCTFNGLRQTRGPNGMRNFFVITRLIRGSRQISGMQACE